EGSTKSGRCRMAAPLGPMRMSSGATVFPIRARPASVASDRAARPYDEQHSAEPSSRHGVLGRRDHVAVLDPRVQLVAERLERAVPANPLRHLVRDRAERAEAMAQDGAVAVVLELVAGI